MQNKKIEEKERKWWEYKKTKIRPVKNNKKKMWEDERTKKTKEKKNMRTIYCNGLLILMRPIYRSGLYMNET